MTYITFLYLGHSYREIKSADEIPSDKDISRRENRNLVVEGPFYVAKDCHYFVSEKK